MSQYRQLLADEMESITAFAAAHGKKWRDILSMTYWYNARIWRDRSGKEHPALHAIRNEFGPSWLYEHFKLPSEAA